MTLAKRPAHYGYNGDPSFKTNGATLAATLAHSDPDASQ